jgi:hypothetical protein
MHTDDVNDEDDWDDDWWLDWRRLAERHSDRRPELTGQWPQRMDASHLSWERWFADQVFPGELIHESSGED